MKDGNQITVFSGRGKKGTQEMSNLVETVAWEQKGIMVRKVPIKERLLNTSFRSPDSRKNREHSISKNTVNSLCCVNLDSVKTFTLCSVSKRTENNFVQWRWWQ